MVAKCRSCQGVLHCDNGLWHHEYCAMHEPEPIEITLEKSDWEKRYREAEAAWGQLKSFTKRVRLDGQTEEYKQLSNLIHSLGRDVFYVNRDDYEDRVDGDGQPSRL